MNQYDFGVKSVWETSFSESSVSAFIRVYANDRVEKMGQACHGGLSRGLFDDELKYVVSRIQPWGRDNHNKSPETTRSYINWLVNDSPYAIGHAVKDVDWILEKKAFIGNVEAPAILMAPALVAARRVHEMPLISYLTGLLINQGVNGNLSYLIAHCITSLTEGGVFYWGDAGREHTTVDPGCHMTISMVKCWINDTKKIKGKKKLPYKERQDYYGYTSLWDGEDVGSDSWLLDTLKTYKFKETEDETVVNPFSASIKSDGVDKGKPYQIKDLIEEAKSVEEFILSKLA